MVGERLDTVHMVFGRPQEKFMSLKKKEGM